MSKAVLDGRLESSYAHRLRIRPLVRFFMAASTTEEILVRSKRALADGSLICTAKVLGSSAI